MIDTQPQIKRVNSDFQVKEMLFLQPVQTHAQSCYGLTLIKSGLTTFEAIRIIRLYFDLQPDEIGYAGLKDEDGVTEQTLSINTEIDDQLLQLFNQEHMANDNQFLRLIKHPYQISPITVGTLLGNQFQIVLRNLNQTQKNYLNSMNKHSLLFLNYYGPQRFGLPNSDKTTHLIGKYIINKNYFHALTLLAQQPNAEGQEAKKYLSNNLDLEQFINTLDKRQCAFYQSAYFSYLWNESLKSTLEASDAAYSTHKNSGIHYYYVDQNSLQRTPVFLPYYRVTPQDGGFIKIKRQRHVYIQFNAVVNNVFADTLNPGEFACSMNFFLPSGVYATVALNQFIYHSLTQLSATTKAVASC